MRGSDRFVCGLDQRRARSVTTRLIYFSNTFSICPNFFSTLPAFFSALPSACRLVLFITLPTVFDSPILRLCEKGCVCSTLCLPCEIAWFRNYIITRLIPKCWVLCHRATLSGRRDPVLPPLLELVVLFSPQHTLPPFILVPFLRATVKIRILCTQR